LEIGINIPVPTYWVDPAFIAEKAEALGFESLWAAEHPIMPVHISTRFYGSADGAVPPTMPHYADPFILFARASAITKRIKFGTGICLVPERNPLLLAKEIATLDYFSRGRFIFGVGAGWLREETEIMGGDFEHRWSQVREALTVMKKLWTNDAVEHHGKYYDFPPVKSFPKPFQKPHPPILLGGMAPRVLHRAVAYADGWLPDKLTPNQLKQKRYELDKLAETAGRDPKSLTITIYGQPPDPDLMNAWRNAGADRVMVRNQPLKSEKEMGQQMERFAKAVL
jgi:probable F420-dependent oxidoreductase